LDYKYLATNYGVGFTDTMDELYRLSAERVIFPINDRTGLVQWQGRTINADTNPRWYNPPGFTKILYNAQAVSPLEVPVIAEGIPSAIACGLTGIAIFGKTLSSAQVKVIADKWPYVILATDPETFVPDFRGAKGKVFVECMQNQLEHEGIRVKTVTYPKEVLELAVAHNLRTTDAPVPDPADFGL
jgi:hypothetical protein